MDYYYVLWMPTVFHRDPLRTSITKKENIEISDNTNKSNIVSVCIDDSENIIVKSVTLNCEIILRKITHSSNGLFLYKHTEIASGIKLFSGGEFPCSLYNAIKDFYHVHEHHSDDEDAHLKVCVCDKQPNIKSLNNEALIHYLRNYETKFINYLSLIKRSCNELSKKKESAAHVFKLNIDSYKSLQELFNKVKGEELYCNSLYKSKYNTLCKTGLINNENNSNLSKIAFNIENSLASIKYLETKLSGEFGFKSSKTSINIAWLAFWIGVGIGIVSILTSVAG